MATPIIGRVIVEITRRHAIIYQTDNQGTVVDQDVFINPYSDTDGEAAATVDACYGSLFDWLNRNFNGAQ